MHVCPEADFRTEIAILCPWEAIPQEVSECNEKRVAEEYATTFDETLLCPQWLGR